MGGTPKTAPIREDGLANGLGTADRKSPFALQLGIVPAAYGVC